MENSTCGYAGGIFFLREMKEGGQNFSKEKNEDG
jgi:hypothetical protein